MQLQEPKFALGCALTVGLGIMLLYVWATRPTEQALRLRIKSDQPAALVIDCLSSPASERQFGKVTKVPADNSPFGTDLGRDHSLLVTDQGYRFTVHSKSGATLVRISGGEPLTPRHVGFFRGCADPEGMW